MSYTLPLLAVMMALLFLIITLAVSNFFSFKKDKYSPFECGFNPLISSRSPFSIQFFLISILFLIFDIEIILILPIPIMFLNNWQFMWSSTIIISILMMGLFFEWKMGSLKWF